MNSSDQTSLTKRYFYKLVSNIVSLTQGLLVNSIIPRALGPALLGTYSYLNDLSLQTFNFLEAGTSQALATKTSQRPNDVNIIRFFILISIAIHLIAATALLIITTTSLRNLLLDGIDGRLLIFSFICGSFTWQNNILIKMLDSLGRTAQLERLRILNALLRMLSIVILFFTGVITIQVYFVFNILFLGLINFNCFKILKGHYRHSDDQLTTKTLKDNFKEFFQYSSPLFTYTCVSSITVFFDRWVLQRYGGSTQQGFFSLAFQLSAVCLMFSSAMIPLFHREVARAAHINNSQRVYELTRKTLPGLFSIAAVLGLFGAFNAKEIVTLLAGPQFALASLPLALMFLYPIHQTYGQIVGTIFYGMGQTRVYRNIGLTSVCLGSIISFIFIAPKELYGLNLGALGLSLKYIVSQLISVHLFLYFSMRHLSQSMIPFVKNQLLIILSFGSSAWAAKTIVDMWELPHVMLKIAFSGCVYLGIISLLLYLYYKFDVQILMDDTKLHFKRIQSLKKHFNF